MPLVALPEDNTERWWLLYTNNNTSHKMLMRTGEGQVSTAISTVFQNFLSKLPTLMVSTSVTGLERAVKGSNVRIPFAYTGTQPTGTGTNVDNDRRARTISFTGRSTDGHKSRIFVFGINDISEGDMRVDITEATAIADAVTHLNGANNVWLSISGLQPTWHQYANIGYNDHWIKEYRKG
jgi:hypothetical protein